MMMMNMMISMGPVPMNDSYRSFCGRGGGESGGGLFWTDATVTVMMMGPGDL